MFESKYSGFLTVLLVIIIVGIVGLLGYLGYRFYQGHYINKDAAAFVDSVINESSDDNNDQNADPNATEIGDVAEASVSGNKNKTYKGFNVVGTIEIPATNLKYPILEKVTKSSIETSVAVLYGPGPNQAGNTVIVGHNYRNGLFFSNNKKLNKGDAIYITDLDGNRVKYTIYDKFNATPEDTSFYPRNTNGAREITLSTCTDNSKERIIILAKADDDA